MTNQARENVHYLIICHTCHERIKSNENYTVWEGSIYCETCFDIYMELVDFDSASK